MKEHQERAAVVYLKKRRIAAVNAGRNPDQRALRASKRIPASIPSLLKASSILAPG
jgi:hypothetical protein